MHWKSPWIMTLAAFLAGIAFSIVGGTIPQYMGWGLLCLSAVSAAVNLIQNRGTRLTPVIGIIVSFVSLVAFSIWYYYDMSITKLATIEIQGTPQSNGDGGKGGAASVTGDRSIAVGGPGGQGGGANGGKGGDGGDAHVAGNDSSAYGGEGGGGGRADGSGGQGGRSGLQFAPQATQDLVKHLMGDRNTVVGAAAPESMGSDNTIVGPTDINGNTIYNKGGTAIGSRACADPKSVAIGAGANAGCLPEK